MAITVALIEVRPKAPGLAVRPGSPPVSISFSAGAHPEFLKSYSAHKFGCPILSAVSSRKGWEPRIPTNGPGIEFSGYGEVSPLSAERPDVGHHEPQPAKPTASPIPKYSAFQATYLLFPPTFYAFRISSSCRPETLAKSANNLQLIKW